RGRVLWLAGVPVGRPRAPPPGCDRSRAHQKHAGAAGGQARRAAARCRGADGRRGRAQSAHPVEERAARPHCDGVPGPLVDGTPADRGGHARRAADRHRRARHGPPGVAPDVLGAKGENPHCRPFYEAAPRVNASSTCPYPHPLSVVAGEIAAASLASFYPRSNRWRPLASPAQWGSRQERDAIYLSVLSSAPAPTSRLAPRPVWLAAGLTSACCAMPPYATTSMRTGRVTGPPP